MATYQQAVSTLDLRAPHSWYPYARAIKRRIIYHGGASPLPLPGCLLAHHCLNAYPPPCSSCMSVTAAGSLWHAAKLQRAPSPAGPTNSGKTYSALQSLSAAKRGVYAGPLRLLAMEVGPSGRPPWHH